MGEIKISIFFLKFFVLYNLIVRREGFEIEHFSRKYQEILIDKLQNS